MQARLLVLEDLTVILPNLNSGFSSLPTSSRFDSDSDVPKFLAVSKKKAIPKIGPGHSRPKALSAELAKPNPSFSPRISTKHKRPQPSEPLARKIEKETPTEKEPE